MAGGDDDLRVLLDAMRTDGMRLRAISLPPAEVLFVKSVLEAYPGLCSVHAPRGRVQGDRAPLIVAAPPQAATEVDAILDELLTEVEARP